MSRTTRGIPYKHYWGSTIKEEKAKIEEYKNGIPYKWGFADDRFIKQLERDLLLHGTESRNYSCSTHYYFNRAHRVGRRVARDQLRPHIVLDDDYDFDDSRYVRVYKGVWWDIY
jgi:hypothetical protein